ncbi:CDGSH iron-sulfur domain-containing protein [Streptomyces sp. NPDC094032]|uniref:CDGSH iron-sulfur domain-containing protein n=1 Tax=Streptomyces sp. NPDC094032 TaxID=3155308 RepID=UPI00331D171D
MSDTPHVQVTENGPYVVTGGVPLKRHAIKADAEGGSRGWEEMESFETGGEYRLCRCGQSAAKPFCDDSHERVGFDGRESPGARVPYLQQAQEQDGPEVVLTDAQKLCAFGRFCDVDGSIWAQVEQPGNAERVQEEAGNCPGGRLVAWKVEGESARPLEPEVSASIAVVEDPAQGVSGGYRVWGSVQVTGADGHAYELRNRVALCRCGASRNKPFCDGSHAAIGFRDGSEVG